MRLSTTSLNDSLPSLFRSADEQIAWSRLARDGAAGFWAVVVTLGGDVGEDTGASAACAADAHARAKVPAAAALHNKRMVRRACGDWGGIIIGPSLPPPALAGAAVAGPDHGVCALADPAILHVQAFSGELAHDLAATGGPALAARAPRWQPPRPQLRQRWTHCCCQRRSCG